MNTTSNNSYDRAIFRQVAINKRNRDLINTYVFDRHTGYSEKKQMEVIDTRAYEETIDTVQMWY